MLEKMGMTEQETEKAIQRMRRASNRYPSRLRPKPKNQAYVVWVGRTLGVFDNWPETSLSTREYPRAKFLGFALYDQAVKAWEDFEDTGVIPSWDEIKALKNPPENPKIAKRKFNKALKGRVEFLMRNFSSGKITSCHLAECKYPLCKC